MRKVSGGAHASAATDLIPLSSTRNVIKGRENLSKPQEKHRCTVNLNYVSDHTIIFSVQGSAKHLYSQQNHGVILSNYSNKRLTYACALLY